MNTKRNSLFNKAVFRILASLFIGCLALTTVYSQEAGWQSDGIERSGTLNEAFAGCPNGGEIRLLSDVTATAPLSLQGKAVTLNGDGFTVMRAAGFTEGDLFAVSGEDGSLTLKKITIDGGAVWEEQGEGESSVNNGIAANGSTVKITDGGSLFIEEGTVVKNAVNTLSSFDSGIINANAGNVVMNGGALCYNECKANGGAVFVSGASAFTMNGGEIFGNRAGNGGAVAVNSSASSFILNGGSLYENRAVTSGNGGAVWSKGSVILTGGTIYKNHALKSGGALYLMNGAEMTGGTIRENSAGVNGNGVYYYSGTAFIIGDSVCIDTSNEIMMLSKRSLTVISELSRHSSAKKIMVNTTYTYDNTLIATFADSTKSTAQRNAAAEEGLSYISHIQDCELSVTDNTIVIGKALSDTEFTAAEGKCYTLRRNGNASAYIYENGTLLAAGGYSSKVKCYWSFEPAGEAGHYYIKNVTSGRYIQSTAVGVSAAVSTGDAPVEFYIAKDMTAGASTYGFYYLCSTDQNINNQSDGTLGLNFGSGGIVAYHIKTGRGNSYWEIEEQAYDYELVPFGIVASLDDRESAAKYHFATRDKRYVAIANGTLTIGDAAAENNAWYFVGASNEREGVMIANYGMPGYTLNYSGGALTLSKSSAPSRWYVKEVKEEGKSYFRFIPFEYKESGDYALTVEGETLFRLADYRSDLAKNLQFYYYPCGQRVNGGTFQYLTKVSITGENVLRELNYTAAARPASYYELVVSSKGTVSAGHPFTLNIEGCASGDGNNNVLGMDIYLYFDWDGDGVFETTAGKMSGSASYQQEIDVPADAASGRHRMRIRATTNDLEGPEEDVAGCTYDFVVDVAQPQELRRVAVRANAAERGGVSLSQAGDNFAYGTQLTATALPQGNSSFLYWKEGGRTLSTDATLTFTVTQNTELTAYFSPNTLAPDAVESIIADGGTEKKATGIYDLRGRKIVIPSKGLYIINGNKTYIK